LLLELDAPDPRAHPHLAAAIEYYMQAQQRFLEGEWRLTVESLRQALSSLVGKKADDEEQEADVPDAIRIARRESREGRLGYEPRWGVVRQAAKFLCDLGAHPEVAETRRHHAYGALVMVGGLLHAGPPGAGRPARARRAPAGAAPPVTPVPSASPAGGRA
jgi:hypothetical protein